jgi:hypothetical protein
MIIIPSVSVISEGLVPDSLSGAMPMANLKGFIRVSEGGEDFQSKSPGADTVSTAGD